MNQRRRGDETLQRLQFVYVRIAGRTTATSADRKMNCHATTSTKHTAQSQAVCANGMPRLRTVREEKMTNKVLIITDAPVAFTCGNVEGKGGSKMSRLIDADALFNQKYKLSDAVKYGNKDAEQQHFSYSTLMMYEIADEILRRQQLSRSAGVENMEEQFPTKSTKENRLQVCFVRMSIAC